MRLLTREELQAHVVVDLGLDASSLDLTSLEALAACVRRAAGFVCPCAPRTLVRSVARALDGIAEDLEPMEAAVEQMVEALTSYGDLIEVPGEIRGKATGRVLCAAPPSFVARANGGALLVGIVPDHRSALPSDMEARVEHVAHVRRLPPGVLEDARGELGQLGLLELSYERWCGAPPPTSADALVAKCEALLARAPSAMEVPGMVILDPTRDVTYYRGRWDAPRSRSGAYVARRPQAYGADLWCYAKLKEGRPERFIDLPLADRARGCDDAWLIQMALDARAGHRQRARVRRVNGTTALFEFFSPVPAWARRRWDAIGEPTPPSKCLFAYRLAAAELDEEAQFMRQRLWLDVITGA